MMTTTPLALDTSTATLAIGTSAGTLVVTAVSALVMGGLGMYTLTHHKRVFVWMKKIRRKDEENTELDKHDQRLEDLYKAQACLTHKPCTPDEFEEVAKFSNMIKGVASHTQALGPELTKVVDRATDYVATDLSKPGPNVKVSLLEHRGQLIRAMKQETARAELEQAIITAQQKIQSLRRS
ncbi:hypothetical protein ACFCYB_33205 [Streptomyces sp. NPDC056309]|uniref:hypothetical protein n=1 Tax=unclassified Streptomyces TaxID=2593676 RepID=UPI0035E0998F